MYLHQIHFVGGSVELYAPLITLETQIWHYMFSTKLFVKLNMISEVDTIYNMIYYFHNLFIIYFLAVLKKINVQVTD